MRILAVLALSPLFLLAEAWAFMIFIGTVHAEWLPMMPTIGFASAVLVGLALALVTSVCSTAVGVAKGVIDE
jgi:hypothetical protein